MSATILRSKPDPLPKDYHIRRHQPGVAEGTVRATIVEDRVTVVDFKVIKTILLMFDTMQRRFDEIEFPDNSDRCLGSLTLEKPISRESQQPPQLEMAQYLFAILFTGDLDFLAHFFGHQGASAKWLCLFCLAKQDQLGETC